MGVTPKSKAIRNITLSVAFLLMLFAASFGARSTQVAGVAITFAAVLGLPSLLLSLADLGRALKIEHAGNFRATAATRILSYYRAAGGAICIAASAYTLGRNIPELLNRTSAAVTLPMLRVVGGVALVLVGFMVIFHAFAKESGESNDT